MALNHNSRTLITTLSILVGLVLIIYALEYFRYFHFVDSVEQSPVQVLQATQAAPRSVSILAVDQAAGPNIRIDQAIINTPSFVVVHSGPSPLDRGVAATTLLQPGNYSSFLLRAARNLKTGEVLTVMIHKDNGDGILHLEEDLPIRSSSGSILSARIKVL